MEENRRYMKEDEIDLRELFNTIIKRKKFIILFTGIVTTLAIIWAFLKTPVYEAKAFVEVGSIDNSAIENPANLVKRLQIVYLDNVQKKQITSVTKVAKVQKAVNLIEINTQSTSNEKAVNKLNEIIDEIKTAHKAKMDNYIGFINEKINNLKAQRVSLEDEYNKFEDGLTIKYNLATKINELSLKISSNNIKQTQIVGKIIINDYPIKPKKKLIVVVAFITGFILSIFLVFFLEFIGKSNEDEQYATLKS